MAGFVKELECLGHRARPLTYRSDLVVLCLLAAPILKRRSWIQLVAADLGNFTGGLVSGYCIRKGISVIGARKWVCAISCLPILAGIPAARVHNAYSALALICVALWGYASWSTMGLTLPSDLFPQDVVATVTGLSGFAAGLAGAVFTFAVGFF